MNNGNILRLSATQIKMYVKCPRQWAYRYLYGLKVRPSGAMKQSGVFHSAAERNYKQKATSQKDLPLDEQTDFFRDAWKDELQREEVRYDEGETADSLEAQGIAIVREHMQKIAPVVIPASADAVEQKILLPLVQKESQTLYELDARIDLTDINGIIRDNKALKPSRVPNQAKLAGDIQLSIYALARRLQTKQVEPALALDVVAKFPAHKGGPKAVTIQTERTRESLQWTLNQMGQVAAGIKASVFPMTDPDNWWCHPKWCGYFDRCRPFAKTVDMAPAPSEHFLAEQLQQSIEQVQQEKSDAGSAEPEG